MKKIKYLSLVLCLMLIPFLSVKAENEEVLEKFKVVAGDNVTASGEVNGSSIVAGNNVSVENTVKGIDMVFANVVNYASNSDYAFIAGNTINIKGNINNDGFIFGNVITFDETFKASRDLFVFGSSISLKGEINRDITIYAAIVDLSGATIKGNLTIYADEITITDSSVLDTLSYNEDAIIELTNSTIMAEEKLKSVEVDTIDIVWTFFTDYVGTLILFAVVALAFPKLFERVENKTKNLTLLNYITMLGWGIFLLIIIPIVSIILLSISVTTGLGLLLLALYIILICLSTLFTGYLIGLLIWKKFIKKDINILLVGLVGISVINILSLIPVVGDIVSILNILISLAIIMKLFTKDA